MRSAFIATSAAPALKGGLTQSSRFPDPKGSAYAQVSILIGLQSKIKLNTAGKAL
jgi:hypothetical protein